MRSNGVNRMNLRQGVKEDPGPFVECFPLTMATRKRPVFSRPSFWVITVTVVALFAAGAWAWRAFYATSYHVNDILISINNGPKRVLPGEVLDLHPSDRIRIWKIHTNIPWNLGVRLAALGIDADALRYDEMRLSDLLSGRDVFKRYRFRVHVKYHNTELGYTDWVVAPYREDWLAKARRVINPVERVAVLERALRMMPGDREVREILLAQYKTLKMWKRAAALLEKEAKKTPDRPVLDRLLKTYSAMGDRDGMISVMARILRCAPGDLNLRRKLGALFEKKGNPKEAIRQYEAVLSVLEKTGGPGKGDGASSGFYAHLGYLYARTGKVKRAISCYLKAAKHDPLDANIYYNLSDLYEKRHQKKKAGFFLAKALKLRPGDTEGRLDLAERKMAAGRLKEAEKYLEQVLHRKPRSRAVLLLMARLREKQGDKKALKGVYKKILSVDPGNETVAYNLAALLYEAGDLKGSLKYFRQYLKKHPDDIAVHDIVFDIYRKTGNTKRALKEAHVLIRLRPKKPAPYRYLFDYWNGRGRYDRIIPVLVKGINANPSLTELREYLALAYVKTGKELPAISEMKAVLKKKPKDIELLLSLARLLEKHDRTDEALAYYKRVIDLSPDNEEAQDGYLRLRLKGVRKQGER